MSSENNSRVAVITGASRGLGEILARFLAGQGYNLILNARGGAALDAVVRSLASYHVEVKAIAGDIAEPSTRRAIVQLAKTLGGLDILVNNASILGTSPVAPLADFPINTLEQVYKANVIAPLALVQEALPLLKSESRAGRQSQQRCGARRLRNLGRLRQQQGRARSDFAHARQRTESRWRRRRQC